MSEAMMLEAIPRHWQDFDHDSKSTMMEHMAVSWLRQMARRDRSPSGIIADLALSEAARMTLEMICLYHLDASRLGDGQSHMKMYAYTRDDLETALEETLKLDTDDVILKQLVYLHVITEDDLAIHGRSLLSCGRDQEA